MAPTRSSRAPRTSSPADMAARRPGLRRPSRLGAVPLVFALLATVLAVVGIGLAPQVAQAAAPASAIRTVAGSGEDSAYSVAVAPNGDIVAAGVFSGNVSLNGKNPNATLTSAGLGDGFVARYTGTGTLLWVKRLGGMGADYVNAVDVDDEGNVYVVGGTESSSISFGDGITLSNGIGEDSFIARYEAGGQASWARRLTGSNGQRLEDIAVSGTKVYAVGMVDTVSTVTLKGATPAADISKTPLSNSESGVLATLSTTGVPQALRIEGKAGDFSYYESVDATSLAVVISGYISGTATFGSGGSTKTLATNGATFMGVTTAYVAGTLAWATPFGNGADDSDANTVTVDGTRVYAGGFMKTDGAFDTIDLLTGDVLHTNFLSGSARVMAVDVGPFGMPYVVGRFLFQLTVNKASGGVFQATAGNSNDLFVASFDPNGDGLVNIETDGSSGSAQALAEDLSVTSTGEVVVAGGFSETIAFGQQASVSSLGGRDAFVTTYSMGPSFHPITPARIVDTRDGTGGPATKIGGGQFRTFDVAGKAGLPAIGVTGAVLNVTATNASASSHLTVWPASSSKPDTSNLNFAAGQTVPDLVITDLSTEGKAAVYNNSGNVDVIVDLVGWYDRDGSGSRFVGVTPSRLMDTRELGGPLGPAETRSLLVATGGSVPQFATAVVANVTVTQPTAPSHLTVWPSGVAKPTASNLNYVAGQTVPNLVIAKIGADKKISIFNNSGNAHVIVDVVGYFTGDAVLGQVALNKPVRMLDTRNGTGGPSTPFGAGETRSLKLAGTTAVPADAKAVIVTFTVTQPTVNSHLTVWPGGGALPLASNLNFVGGQTVANSVMVRLGPDGTIQMRNNTGNVHVIADVVGYYA